MHQNHTFCISRKKQVYGSYRGLFTLRKNYQVGSDIYQIIREEGEMMKKKLIISIVLTVLFISLISIVLWFIKEENKPKVIVVVQRLDIEYWKIFESGAKAAFRDFDIDGEVLSPDSIYPLNKIPNLLKKVLKQQPDALIVTPVDSSAAIPVLVEYKEKNIPVLLAYNDIEWESKTSYIGTNNHALGKTAGKLLGSMLQPGDQVAIIFGGLNDQPMIDRKNSAKKVLEDIGVEVVIEQSAYDHLGNPKPIIGSILKQYPNIKGIVATSDRLALATLKSLQEKALNIPVIGADGITEMLEFTEAGKVNATVTQNPYDMAYLSVEQALKAIKREHVDQKIDIGIDIITEDNVKERLDFQKKLLE